MTGKRSEMLYGLALKLVRGVSSLANLGFLLILLLCLLAGSYALYDSAYVNSAASNIRFAQYKPTENDSPSYAQLVGQCEDLLGWIEIYGTQVDYPIVQDKERKDNEKYLTTDVLGNKSASGSIFLDIKNSPDFSDFNSILHGHHMNEHRMFGDIGLFDDEDFFDSHLYGTIYYDDTLHGLSIFALLEEDAYQAFVYTVCQRDTEDARKYLDEICEQAKYTRDLEISDTDRIVLLSTCTMNITNGRHILAAKITDEVPENPFLTDPDAKFQVDSYSLLDEMQHFLILIWALALFLIALLLWLICKLFSRLLDKWKKRNRGTEQ